MKEKPVNRAGGRERKKRVRWNEKRLGIECSGREEGREREEREERREPTYTSFVTRRHTLERKSINPNIVFLRRDGGREGEKGCEREREK